MPFQTCPQHGSEDVAGLPVEDAPGAYEYICNLPGHIGSRPLAWLEVPPAPGLPGLASIAHELSLQIELPAVLQQFGGCWVEYGVLERAYAQACPGDFMRLVEMYGHRHLNEEPKKYTVSMFLAGTLGNLAKQGYLDYHNGSATGYWAKHLSKVSWWALPPGPEWTPDNQLSNEADGNSLDYLVGASG